MDDTKAWWRSRTILASGIALLAVLARLAGHEIGPEEESALIDALSSLIAVAASLAAIWGRLRANSTLRSKAPAGGRS